MNKSDVLFTEFQEIADVLVSINQIGVEFILIDMLHLPSCRDKRDEQWKSWELWRQEIMVSSS